MLLLGVHVLVYLKRALATAKDDVDPASRFAVRGAGARAVLLAAAIVSGLLVGLGTLSVQHRWLHLPPKHDHGERDAGRPTAR
jgi:hypothetical protein